MLNVMWDENGDTPSSLPSHPYNILAVHESSPELTGFQEVPPWDVHVLMGGSGNLQAYNNELTNLL